RRSGGIEEPFVPHDIAVLEGIERTVVGVDPGILVHTGLIVKAGKWGTGAGSGILHTHEYVIAIFRTAKNEVGIRREIDKYLVAVKIGIRVFGVSDHRGVIGK